MFFAYIPALFRLKNWFLRNHLLPLRSHLRCPHPALSRAFGSLRESIALLRATVLLRFSREHCSKEQFLAIPSAFSPWQT